MIDFNKITFHRATVVWASPVFWSGWLERRADRQEGLDRADVADL